MVDLMYLIARVFVCTYTSMCDPAGRAELASRDQSSNLISLSNTGQFVQEVLIKKPVHQCKEPLPPPWQPVS